MEVFVSYLPHGKSWWVDRLKNNKDKGRGVLEQFVRYEHRWDYSYEFVHHQCEVHKEYGEQEKQRLIFYGKPTWSLQSKEKWQIPLFLRFLS